MKIKSLLTPVGQAGRNRSGKRQLQVGELTTDLDHLRASQSKTARATKPGFPRMSWITAVHRRFTVIRAVAILIGQNVVRL